MLRMISLLILATLFAGCAAAIGPVDSPDFPQLVAKAVPKIDGEIRFYGSGNWYPNTRGFTPERSALIASPPNAIPGVLVVTNDAILLQQWDDKEKAFDIVKRLPFTELTSVALDSYGVSRRIVVRKRDLSYESFDFTHGSGIFVDAPKVEEVFTFLRDRIKP
jgi:hypothetical protein